MVTLQDNCLEMNGAGMTATVHVLCNELTFDLRRHAVKPRVTGLLKALFAPPYIHFTCCYRDILP